LITWQGISSSNIFSGQATYQSEVTERIYQHYPWSYCTDLDKDQYKLLADVNQLIYDGVLSNTKKYPGLSEMLNSRK
jgi:hypothetical protein